MYSFNRIIKNILATFILLGFVCYTAYDYIDYAVRSAHAVFFLENEMKYGSGANNELNIIETSIYDKDEATVKSLNLSNISTKSIAIISTKKKYELISTPSNPTGPEHIYELLSPYMIEVLEGILLEKIDVDNLTRKQMFVLADMFDLVLRHSKEMYQKYPIEEQHIYNQLFKEVRFLGDSQINYCKRQLHEFDSKMFYPMPGKALKDQYKEIDDFLSRNEKIKYIFFFNGFNIAYVKSPDVYVEQYEAMIEKIKATYPDVKVFISSFVNAIDRAIQKDIREGNPHKIAEAPIYDAKLKEKYLNIQGASANYFNINWMVRNELYVDITHFNSSFYHTYVAFATLFAKYKYKDLDNYYGLKEMWYDSFFK